MQSTRILTSVVIAVLHMVAHFSAEAVQLSCPLTRPLRLPSPPHATVSLGAAVLHCAAPSAVDRHLGCFQFAAITNHTAPVSVSLGPEGTCFSGIHGRVGPLGTEMVLLSFSK